MVCGGKETALPVDGSSSLAKRPGDAHAVAGTAGEDRPTTERESIERACSRPRSAAKRTRRRRARASQWRERRGQDSLAQARCEYPENAPVRRGGMNTLLFLSGHTFDCLSSRPSMFFQENLARGPPAFFTMEAGFQVPSSHCSCGARLSCMTGRKRGRDIKQKHTR